MSDDTTDHPLAVQDALRLHASAVDLWHRYSRDALAEHARHARLIADTVAALDALLGEDN